MTFWTGLLLGWIIGSIGTGIVLMFFAAVKDVNIDAFLHNDIAPDLEDRRQFNLKE